MPDELKKIIPGNTPLTDEDLEGLLLPHITTKGELNEIEQQNITDAEVKYFSKKYKPDDLLNWKFMRELHKDMLGHVWDWAGTQRIRETTIGIDPAYIMAEFGQLLSNVQYWVESRTFNEDEIAARLHHGLVRIHLFQNGNGRHARITADLLLKSLGHERFTWGKSDLYDHDVIRTRYINSLVSADKHDFSELLNFVRSS